MSVGARALATGIAVAQTEARRLLEPMLLDVEGRLRQVEYALMRNTQAANKVVSMFLPSSERGREPLSVTMATPVPLSVRRAAARKPATARTRAAARTTRRAGG